MPQKFGVSNENLVLEKYSHIFQMLLKEFGLFYFVKMLSVASFLFLSTFEA